MRTILLADDEKHIREFCRRELEEEGYRVLLAPNGVEAVETFSKERPDVAVLDLSMPVAGGLETAARLRAVDPGVPVIFFTAHDEDCLADARCRFAAACVEKSEDLTELKRAILHSLLTRMGRTVSKERIPIDVGPYPQSR